MLLSPMVCSAWLLVVGGLSQGDTKERELLKCVVAVKECIRGEGRHLQDVIFQTLIIWIIVS